MSQTHSLRAEIDATGAGRGAAEFESAVKRMADALRNTERSAERSLNNINSRLGNINFGKMASDIARLSAMRIDAGLVTSVASLSRTLSKFRGISPGAIASIANLSNTISSLSGVNTTKLSQIATVFSGFRAPTQAQIRNFTDFVTALNSLHAPTNTGAIIQSLARITTAATQTRIALQHLAQAGSRINLPNINMRGGRTNTGSSTRASAGAAVRGGGVGSGLITPSMAYGTRGLEASFNTSRQLGTVIQGAVGGITAGNLMQQIFSATDSVQKFRAALLATGDSSVQVDRQMEAVQRSVRDFGMNLFSTREQFASFNAAVRASGVSGERATTMFQDAALAMRNMGLGPQQQEGALRAISQMFGKGRIMSEELFQQMSEHWTAFPGVLAQTLGVSMAELRQRMQRETLNPRVIEQVLANARTLSEGAAQTVSGRMRTSAEQVRTAWRDLMAELGEGPAGQAMVGMFERARDILRAPDFCDAAQRIGVGLADLIRQAGDALLWMSQNTDKVGTALKAVLALSAINFFGGIAGAVGNLLAPVARLSGLLWGLTAAQGAAAGAGGAAATGGGLSGVFAAATGAASGLGSVLGRLLAFATGPFGGAALAIGAVGTALYDNRDAVFRVGGEVTTLGRLFKTVFDDTLTATGAFGQGLVDKLKPYFAQLSDRFSQTWSSMFSDEISFGQRILGRVLRFTDENAIRAPFNTQRVQEMRRGQDAINQIGMATNYGANTSDGGASYRAAVALIRATVEARISDINRAAEAAVAGINPTDTPGLRTLGITSEQARRSRMIELNSGPADPAERAAMESALGERGDRLPNGPRPLQRPEGNPWGARPGRGGGANAQETFESFRGQLDPSFRVQNQMTTGMRDLAEAQRKGWITAQQRVDLEGRLRESMLETIQALDPRTKAERQLSEATQLLTGMQREGLITDDQRAQRLAVITERLRDNIDPFGTMLRQIQEETGLTRLSSREMEVESQVRQRVQQLRERGVNLSDSETEQLRTALRLQREMTQAQQDREQGLGTWANSFRSIGTEMDKLSEKFTNEFAGALADFVSTGKANFTDLANSIVRDINELIIKNGLRALMSELGVINGDTKSGYSNSGFSLGRLFGGIWGGGGASAGAGAGGGMFDGGAAFGGADAFSSAAGSFSGAGAFREGGYATNPVSRGLMSATAWMDAPQYREGTSNTSNGIPAILHPNEAVIPLSRGRRVPVEMRGGGAPSVRVEMNITTPDANSFRKSQGQIASEAGKVISRASRRNG